MGMWKTLGQACTLVGLLSVVSPQYGLRETRSVLAARSPLSSPRREGVRRWQVSVCSSGAAAPASWPSEGCWGCLVSPLSLPLPQPSLVGKRVTRYRPMSREARLPDFLETSWTIPNHRNLFENSNSCQL